MKRVFGLYLVQILSLLASTLSHLMSIFIDLTLTQLIRVRAGSNLAQRSIMLYTMKHTTSNVCSQQTTLKQQPTTTAATIVKHQPYLDSNPQPFPRSPRCRQPIRERWSTTPANACCPSTCLTRRFSGCYGFTWLHFCLWLCIARWYGSSDPHKRLDGVSSGGLMRSEGGFELDNV